MKTKGYFRSVILGGCVILLIGWLLASPAPVEGKETIKLKIGSGHPTATDWIRFLSDYFCKEVVKRVNERTNYRLELSEHWAGSVAKLGEELESAEIGLLDMAGIIVPFEPTKLYLHNYGYNIPFFPGDPKVNARINTKLYREFPALKNEFRKYNQIYLGSGSMDDYGLSLNFPMHTAADIKGRKIAAAGPNLPWISGVGAVPVQGNLNEAYTGLQTGVYEGWVMFVTSVVGFKLYEISKHYTHMNFGATPNVVIITINAKVWDKLPKEVQAILQEVADDYSLKEPEYMVERHNKCIKIMQDGGVNLYQMPFEEKVKYAKLLINQPKKFAKEADAKGWPGTALMSAAIKYAQAEGHIFPRKWMDE